MQNLHLFFGLKKKLPAPSENGDGMWVHDLYDDNQEEPQEEEEIEEETTVDSSNPGKVVLKNLSWEIIEDKLKEICEEVGPVKSVFIKYDYSGRSEGRGHVIYESAKDAVAAVKHLDGMELKGEKLGATFVELKEKPAPRQQQRAEPRFERRAEKPQPKQQQRQPKQQREAPVVETQFRVSLRGAEEPAPSTRPQRGGRGGKAQGQARPKQDVQPKFSFDTLDDDLEKYQQGRK